jgi:hypothetical protein
MEASIEYADVIDFLQKYYEKEYEGYDVSFEFKKRKREGECHGWFEGDTYEYNEMYGMVRIKRTFNGEWNSRKVSFPVNDSIYVSKEELESIIISSFNETVEKDHLIARSVYPGDEALIVTLERTDVKKLVKGI